MTRTKLADRILPNYTRGEEIFNMTSHIVGGVLRYSCYYSLRYIRKHAWKCLWYSKWCNIWSFFNNFIHNV